MFPPITKIELKKTIPGINPSVVLILSNENIILLNEIL